MLLFRALISTRTNTYVISYNLVIIVVYIVHVVSYRYHPIYRMISVSRYPEHILDIDIDISRKYRMIYIENSRCDAEHYYQQKTPYPHIRVRKSSPQLIIYSLYILLYIPRISQPTASRADRINLRVSTQSNHMGRINLEPSQATASRHWSPHSILIRVWVGFGPIVAIITYFTFFPRRPSTIMSILVQLYSSNTHVVKPWELFLKTALL